MRLQLINFLFFSLVAIHGVPAMAYPKFTCAYERDHNPPLDPEAELWFQEARGLEKELRDWPRVVELYEQAIAKDHWKAMHNLARLYRTGWPGRPGVEKNTQKMLDLYERMVELKVPLGYYNWAVAAERGKGMLRDDRMASSYMFQAAQLGSPQAQVALGNFFAFSLPREKQDDVMAEQYFQCAGAQEVPEAIIEAAQFFEISKDNQPRALFYYQRAAALGSTNGLMELYQVFNPESGPAFTRGYKPDKSLSDFYKTLMYQVNDDPELRFPDLAKKHPLPPHPKQGYDAEHPDRRFEL
ncbi:tetratricopeptide repeat protein [Pseudomonas sp. BMS12]|uniref:tetratricopeptide repeat protein n=1 Tax=Pseudomonas sp. BMS12 TaxID=1796033 RepID=UPI00083B308C|nr:tetratricopeptide repeat protein [Pseudomonas sp. BMS12]